MYHALQYDSLTVADHQLLNGRFFSAGQLGAPGSVVPELSSKPDIVQSQALDVGIDQVA